MVNNKLNLALLTSSLFIIIQAKASPLQVGPGVVACENNATCTSDGVNFIDPTGKLTVTAVNIGQNATTGVSVTASGGTGGEIEFKAGASTILGSVTASPVPSTNLLKTITINDAMSDVTAAGNLHIINLNFKADGIFSLNENVNLIGAVTSIAPNTGSLIFKGNSVTGGDISGLKLVSLNAGTLTLNNNITATSTTIAACSTLLVNTNLLVLSTNLANNGTLDMGLNTLTTDKYSGSADSIINVHLTQGPVGGNLTILNSLTPALPTTSTLNLFVVGNDISSSATPVTIVNASPGTLFVGPIIPNTPLYDFTPDYSSGTKLDIRITRTHTMAQATQETPALAGISNFFDSIGSTIITTAPTLVPLYNALRTKQTLVGLNDALFSIVPNVSGYLRAASYLGAGRIFNIAADRMGMGIDCECVLIGCKKKGFWAEGTAGEIVQEIVDGAPGYHVKGSGVALGSDMGLNPNVMLGWGLAYTRVNSDTRQLCWHLKTNSYQAFVYGRSNLFCGWYLDAALGLATNHHYLDRSILVPTADVANSSFSGWQFNGYAETGYEFSRYGFLKFLCNDRWNKLFFVPYLAVNYSNLITDSYHECVSLPSSSAVALSVHYDPIQEMKLGPGFKLAYQMGSKCSFTPYFKLTALHDFAANSQSALASFEGFPEVSFRTVGPRSAVTSLVTTVGFVWSRNNTCFVTLEYDYEHTDHAFAMHSGFLKYRHTWM